MWLFQRWKHRHRFVVGPALSTREIWRSQYEIRDASIARLGFASYYEYRMSSGYRQRREVARQRAGGLCEECDSDVDLQVHHLHYETIGFEGLNDLKVLCGRCHECAHYLSPFASWRAPAPALAPPATQERSGRFGRPPEERLFVVWLKSDSRAKRAVAVAMGVWVLLLVLAFTVGVPIALAWVAMTLNSA